MREDGLDPRGRHGRKPWTAEEDSLLRLLWRENKGRHEIAATLGRSPMAVATRANALGLAPRDRADLRRFEPPEILWRRRQERTTPPRPKPRPVTETDALYRGRRYAEVQPPARDSAPWRGPGLMEQLALWHRLDGSSSSGWAADEGED